MHGSNGGATRMQITQYIDWFVRLYLLHFYLPYFIHGSSLKDERTCDNRSGVVDIAENLGNEASEE